MSSSPAPALPVFSLAAFETADDAGRSTLALDFRRICLRSAERRSAIRRAMTTF